MPRDRTGAGVDLSVALSKTINLRLGLTNVNFDSEQETISVGDPGFEEDTIATFDADYGAGALLLDWYIFDGTFHVSAGMVENNGALGIVGVLQPGVDYTVGGQTSNSMDIVGDISGDISLDESYEPYIGIGWGRKAGSDGGFSLTMDLGVVMLDPQGQLQAMVAPGGNFSGNQAALDATLKRC